MGTHLQHARIGNASITIRTSTTRRTSGATSTTAVPTACTTAIRPRCGSRSTTAIGSATIRVRASFTKELTSPSTCFRSRRILLKQAASPSGRHFEQMSDRLATGRVVFRATESVRHRLGGHSSTREHIENEASRTAAPGRAKRRGFVFACGRAARVASYRLAQGPSTRDAMEDISSPSSSSVDLDELVGGVGLADGAGAEDDGRHAARRRSPPRRCRRARRPVRSSRPRSRTSCASRSASGRLLRVAQVRCFS